MPAQLLGLSESVGDYLAHVVKGARHGFCVRNNGQKIGVAAPAGQNMLVQVVGYARSPDFALIHTNVEPVVMGHFAQNPHGALSQVRHFKGFFFGCLVVQRNVAVRADEQVPRIIGVQVKQREGVLPTVYNERFLITA